MCQRHTLFLSRPSLQDPTGCLNHLVPVLLVLCLGLSLAGCNESPRLAPISVQGTILAFGDSLTYGTGVKATQSYPAVLEQLSGRKVVRSGVPGETTAEGLRRLPAVLETVVPDLVILELGGNDILRRQSLQKAKDNLAQMVKLIRGQGIEVMLVGVPEFGLIPDTAEIFQELGEELLLATENDVVAELMTDAAMKSDTVHFNAQGYRKMAEAIFRRLQELGAI